MDKTPKGKSLRFVRSNDKAPQTTTNNQSSSTPIKESKKPRRWENDIISTQEHGDIDVTWDWDSPKNIKPKPRRINTRTIHKSPKLVPKKTSQIDHIKNFEKLKEELQALRNEIARVDEDCLPLSPVDEQTVREESAKDCSDIDSFIEEQYFHIENQEREICNLVKETVKDEINKDLFDDSCDEQLILCSQIIEDKFVGSNNGTHNNVNSNIASKLQNGCNGTHITNLKIESFVNQNRINQAFEYNDEIKLLDVSATVQNRSKTAYSTINQYSEQNRTVDDSFDAVLKEFEDEDIDVLTQAEDNHMRTISKRLKSNVGFKRTFSDANVQYIPHQNSKEVDSKFTFHRTHSFESSTVSKKDDLPQHVMENMERKRLEALAKLKEKKREKCSQVPSSDTCHISPMKCSPEEIEQKRLQAKAIREAKQREIIEKNRQEALKRLETNRLKRMGSMKKNM